MNKTSVNRFRKTNTSGFSLVELIVVIAIMSILTTIIVPNYIEFRDKTKKEVCNANYLQLERMYEMHLLIEDVNHSYNMFSRFLQGYSGKIYPDEGLVSYEDGEVKCSFHNREDDNGDEDEVPYI